MVAVNGAADLPGEATPVQAILVNISTGSTIGVVNSPSSPLASPHAVAISRDQSCIFVVELNGIIQQFHLKGTPFIIENKNDYFRKQFVPILIVVLFNILLDF